MVLASLLHKQALLSYVVLLTALCSTRVWGHFTNEWATHIPGGEKVADRVARELGYQNHGRIGSLDDYYLFYRRDVGHREKRGAHHHTRRLIEDPRVKWAEQQVAVQRMKRDLIDKRSARLAYSSVQFNDAGWPNEWYLFESLAEKRAMPVRHDDLGVVPVWNLNITGSGVVVTILDDGLEHNHTDIKQNYDPKASTDLNGKDDDPFPRYDPTNENKHGTRCGGEVAMIANNGKCGVGVAYNARIGGVRMLDGVVTDRSEAAALSFNIDHIDIFSASWGPNDDGKTVEGPGKLAREALRKGVTEGRGGKGVIYVWASGNGGTHYDNCDCDGYTSSPLTLSISSASQHRKSPWYAEKCASTMATTYSSGTFSDQKILTTDLHDRCTNAHTGTSASAPLAAGIFALVLQSNPDITWRDMQHLVVWTSQWAPLKDNVGWKTNGAGLKVNSRFGFGLLNAAALVNAADPKLYKTVPPSVVCTVHSNSTEDGFPKRISNGKEVLIAIKTSGCKGQENEINYLEHVEVVIGLEYTKRGDLEIFVTSPSKTETMLLSRRPADRGRRLEDWPFMSVHSWGEDPSGIWLVKVIDNGKSENSGTISSVSLILHGTKEKPDIMARGPALKEAGIGAPDAKMSQMVDEDENESTVDDGDPVDAYGAVNELGFEGQKGPDGEDPFDALRDKLDEIHSGTARNIPEGQEFAKENSPN